jgi:ABC-type siderophore export system fused ATPase/permease subunit
MITHDDSIAVGADNLLRMKNGSIQDARQRQAA